MATDEEKVSVKFKGKRTIVEKREVSNDVYAWGQGAPPPPRRLIVLDSLTGVSSVVCRVVSCVSCGVHVCR